MAGERKVFGAIRVLLGAHGAEIPSDKIVARALTALNPKHSVEPNVPFFVVFNNGAAQHTIELLARDPEGHALTPALPAGTGWCFPSSTFAQVRDTQANGAVFVWSSDVPLSAMTQSNPIANPLPVTSSPTVVDAQGVKTTTVAAAQAEETLQAGANNVPDGALIRFSLSIASATAADDATVSYVALKGATSGVYIASATLGTAVAGTIRKSTGSSEIINIVAANAGAVGHAAAGSWSAENGD